MIIKYLIIDSVTINFVFFISFIAMKMDNTRFRFTKKNGLNYIYIINDRNTQVHTHKKKKEKDISICLFLFLIIFVLLSILNIYGALITNYNHHKINAS